MAKVKDALRHLINQQDPLKEISTKWIDKEPSLSDFNLEGKDLNMIYNERMKLEDNKNLRINGLEKTRPEKVKTGFLPEKSWESFATLICIVVLGCYAAFVRPVSMIIVGILGALALAFFIKYFLKVNSKDSAYKKKMQEIDDKINSIKEEETEYEEDYQNLVKFAEASYDHTAWNRRKDPDFWYKAEKNIIASELVSMNRLYGIPSELLNDKFLSLSYENTHGRDFSLYVSKTQVNMKEMNKFRESSDLESLRPGTVVAIKGVLRDVKEDCEEDDIIIWNAEDLADFAKTVEEYCLDK